MAVSPSYADSASDTASTISSLSAVGDLRDFDSPTIDPPSAVVPQAGAAQYTAFRPLSSSPGPMESGSHEATALRGRDTPHADNAPISSAARGNLTLDTLLQAYRRIRIDAEDNKLIESFTEIWLVANATRPKEDINVAWPGDLVETRVSEAWSRLLPGYEEFEYYTRTKLYTPKNWGDLQELLLYLKLQVPYIYGVKDWVKRLLERNKDTPDDDNSVFLPGYRSKHPASVAWKKWESMAHKMGPHVEFEGRKNVMRGFFKVFKPTCVEGAQYGALRLVMERLLRLDWMKKSLDMRSEAQLSYHGQV